MASSPRPPTPSISVPEIFNYWLQPGRIDVGFLGAAQIDKFGNINTTIVGGDYARPQGQAAGRGRRAGDRRLLQGGHRGRQAEPADVRRAGGLHHLGRLRRRPRRPRAARPARKGPQQIITDLGMLTPDPRTCEFTMTGMFPGVSAETIRERTGWDVESPRTG